MINNRRFEGYLLSLPNQGTLELRVRIVVYYLSWMMNWNAVSSPSCQVDLPVVLLQVSTTGLALAVLEQDSQSVLERPHERPHI